MSLLGKIQAARTERSGGSAPTRSRGMISRTCGDTLTKLEGKHDEHATCLLFPLLSAARVGPAPTRELYIVLYLIILVVQRVL